MPAVAASPDDPTIVILAGGHARRLPDKLAREIQGEPMLVRVFERLRGRWPIAIAARGGFPPELDARLACTVVVDRWPGKGPLAALVSAAGALDATRLFVVAGDLPFIDRAALERLMESWNGGDEAVVFRVGDRLQPLAALYDRAALLREGFDLLRSGTGAMHALLERLKVRIVPSEASSFFNVNTPDDFDRAIHHATKGTS